jgi:hypothetical protein
MFRSPAASSGVHVRITARSFARARGARPRGVRRSRDRIAACEELERRINLSSLNLSGLWVGTLTDPEVSDPNWQQTISLAGSSGSFTGYRLSQDTGSASFVEWSDSVTESGDQVEIVDSSIFTSYEGSTAYVPITAKLTLSGETMAGTWSGPDQGKTDTGTIELNLESGPSGTRPRPARSTRQARSTAGHSMAPRVKRSRPSSILATRIRKQCPRPNWTGEESL